MPRHVPPPIDCCAAANRAMGNLVRPWSSGTASASSGSLEGSEQWPSIQEPRFFFLHFYKSVSAEGRVSAFAFRNGKFCLEIAAWRSWFVPRVSSQGREAKPSPASQYPSARSVRPRRD